MTKPFPVPAILLLTLYACGVPQQPPRSDSGSLEMYFIDVEGGQATLIVGPTGESMLVDTGWPEFGGRDADRIERAARDAGVTAIDHLVITHYHDDHVGGIDAIVDRLPVRQVITHGPNNETGRMSIAVAPIFENAIRKIGVEPTVVRPGDEIPIGGLEVRVVAADREVIGASLPGGGTPNPACAGVTQRPPNTSENAASVAMLFTFGDFRFLNLGDLTQDLEYVLACPENRIGEIDLYLTTHHGSAQSNAEVLVHALRPRVAIMNNGARKGGDAAVVQTVLSSPGLEELWMLHFAEAGGDEGNVADPFIANPTDAPTATGHDTGFGIRVSARSDGSFTVTNERNGVSRTYPARR